MWEAQDYYPELPNSTRIAFDCETNDPNLLTKGPGFIRKDGYICGFSIATDDGFKGYYPLRHEGGGNVSDIEQAKRWLKSQLTRNVPIVGANLLYDCGWVQSDFGFKVTAPKYDVQVADPLLDENWPNYKLNSLAERWLGLHKDEELLYIEGAKYLGVTSACHEEDKRKKEIVDKVKGLLWKLPASFVGPYGEVDATLPIQIFELQEKALKEQGLWDLFILETKVQDLLIEMQFQGVPVNIPEAERVAAELETDFEIEMSKITARVGFRTDVWAAESLVKVCEVLQLPYLKTKKGNPSFEAEWLAMQEHPVFKMILEARQLDRCGGVFIRDKIINCAVNGRIYPQYWQVKNDRGGTVSGRFASSNPNAQQFPARNEKLARKTRGLLTAEPGCRWSCFDYSQQEPRVTVHYATLLSLREADKAAKTFIDNPDTDYHQMVSDWTGIKRKTAKEINLGIAYGMGQKKYAEKYGKTPQEAKDLFSIYNTKLPFIRDLSEYTERVAKQRGYIKTLLGRHCHFNLYGPPQWKEGMKPLKKEAAIKEFGYPVMQYFTYKAMNRLIQGSSADMIKKAMVDCWQAGYLCSMTVHDELDFAHLETEKQMKEVKEIMLNCVQLKVPLKLDLEVGANWGNMELLKLE